MSGSSQLELSQQVYGWTRRAALAALLSSPACLPAMMGSISVGQPRPRCVQEESSGFVQVPGGRIWWQRFGSGTKTPILAVHGGPGAAHNYLLPLRALADDRQVIYYDQLGCGLSDAPRNQSPFYCIARAVSDLQAVRSGLGLERVILYGHSWGATTVMEYLLGGASDGVESLILAGATASVPQYMSGMRRLVAALPDDAGVRILELEAAGLVDSREYSQLHGLFHSRHVLRSAPSPDFAASVAFLVASPARKVLYGPGRVNVTGNIRSWDRSGELDAIRVPTLITTGETDKVTLDCHETIHRGISGSKLRVLPGCSHYTMQEAPEAYNDLLRAFIA